MECRIKIEKHLIESESRVLNLKNTNDEGVIGKLKRYNSKTVMAKEIVYNIKVIYIYIPSAESRH